MCTEARFFVLKSSPIPRLSQIVGADAFIAGTVSQARTTLGCRRIGDFLGDVLFKHQFALQQRSMLLHDVCQRSQISDVLRGMHRMPRYAAEGRRLI